METSNATPTGVAILTVSQQEWNETKQQIAEIVAMVKENADSNSEYLTAQETCKMLKIGRATFERLKNNGTLPVYSVNGAKRKYSKKSEILRLLHEGKY